MLNSSARPAPDDIALDISQSSGAASPPEETGRTKRKRGQKEKENSNGGMDVSVGSDSSVSGKEQTGGDSESLVLWRWEETTIQTISVKVLLKESVAGVEVQLV